ncbi:MAG: DNA mismatch endonuclease Vsr [Acidobacteriia bacterium]|nr:DNA mismatch endonuclease Vsr [Terriglobia bacterium]
MDNLSKRQRSQRMSLIRSKDTGPELRVRKLAHQLGFRFRLHSRRLPGRPDLVFPRLRKALFVHGCFWHRHSGCSRNRTPKSRLEFWVPKLKENRIRDKKTVRCLERLGFKVGIVWECETEDSVLLARKLRRFLSA